MQRSTVLLAPSYRYFLFPLHSKQHLASDATQVGQPCCHIAGHGTFTASARSQLCKSRQLPLQTHPPDHARAQGRSRRSLLTLRASLVPDGSCGGQGRPLFTAPQRDSAAPGKSSHCVVNFYHLTDIEHPHKASSLPAFVCSLSTANDEGWAEVTSTAFKGLSCTSCVASA